MSLAGAGDDDADTVLLEITDASLAAGHPSSPPTPPPPISASDLACLDPLPSSTIAVRADRNRLIESSSYFRALLGGSFSESGMGQVRINCNLEAAVQVLRFLFGPSAGVITHENFLLLLEGGLFLGVEILLMECEHWFRTMSSQKSSSLLVSLDFIIETWNFAQEHGVTFVQDICPEYLARNFVQVIPRSSFAKIPYDLLCSSIQCLQLTVDSEKQLCEAILYWISKNAKPWERSQLSSVNGQMCILSKVKICLLPLDFAAGIKRNWVNFGNKIIRAILHLLNGNMQILLDSTAEDKLESYRIRITEYSKKVVLSGCPQISTAFLYISVLPTDLDAEFKRKLVSSYTQVNHQSFNLCKELERTVKTLSFENVHEVDLSRCPKVHFGAAIDWLKPAFPKLRTFRASYCLQFQSTDLLYLLLRCPWIDEIDLTVDISTVLPKLSIISSSSEVHRKMNRRQDILKEMCSSYNIERNSAFSSISKLTLEGRNDINDLDLLEISELTNSLCYINIRNCTLLTDVGISMLLLKCPNIHAMVLSYTSFGRHSVRALCTCNRSNSFTDHNDECSRVMAFNMQELHLDGCKDAISQLLSNTNMVKLLCLRETSLTDDALCKFIGSSLESLDISETMVSMVSVSPIIQRNSNLRCLKATGCRSLLFKCDESKLLSGNKYGDILQGLSKTCLLENVEMGWGFSPIRTEDLVPSFSKVRKLTVGLGTTLGENVLHALPEICPCLESLVLRFQVISDKVAKNLLKSSTDLQELSLHCCLGNLTSVSFQTKVPALKILQLKWVTPWITNEDLIVLAQNCSNLVELSLAGCKLLDSNSQEIMSSGWPNLTRLHLEECGQITNDGVSLIFNCKVLEDLLLRHNGRGIGRNIINDAISELPLLRILALDLCDASEEGYDSPNPEGKLIRTVKMSRCKPVSSCFEPYRAGSLKPAHKETIILEWGSKELRTTIVKERV